ncbi:unnamed protein product [Tilletia caries]|nr:unnamed protein product [Tilletia caries]
MATQIYQGAEALTRQRQTGATDTPRQAQYPQQAAGPSSSTPHPQFPGVSTQDIQLQRLTELEIQYGISPPHSPNEMPIEARLERIDGMKRDWKAEDRLRRDRRRSIRQLEHSVRVGSAARQEGTGSGGSAGTTTTTHDRVERLETDLSRLDARLEEDFSKINSRITDVFGKPVEEFKGTRQESTILTDRSKPSQCLPTHDLKHKPVHTEENRLVRRDPCRTFVRVLEESVTAYNKEVSTAEERGGMRLAVDQEGMDPVAAGPAVVQVLAAVQVLVEVKALAEADHPTSGMAETSSNVPVQTFRSKRRLAISTPLIAAHLLIGFTSSTSEVKVFTRMRLFSVSSEAA